MSLEKLLEKIEEDARAEAEEIMAKARREAEEIRRRGKEEAGRAGENILAAFRERGERERVRMVSAARMENRLAILAAKERILEETLQKTVQAMEEMPREEYRAWLKSILANHAVTGKEEVIPSSFDRELLQDGLLQEINQTIDSMGKRGELRLSTDEAPFKRGVILREGNVYTRLSVESLLREAGERNEEEVLKILFGEGSD